MNFKLGNPILCADIIFLLSVQKKKKKKEEDYELSTSWKELFNFMYSYMFN